MSEGKVRTTIFSGEIVEISGDLSMKRLADPHSWYSLLGYPTDLRGQAKRKLILTTHAVRMSALAAYSVERMQA
jgi:hypothetical protein